MKPLSIAAWLTVLTAILVTAGCAHVPVSETTQYADAFRNVAAVTRDLIDDYAAACDAIAAQDVAPVQEPMAYPLQFDPNAAKTAETVPPALAGFENALRAVEEYNAVLLDIANGGNDANLAARATAISNYIDQFNILPAGIPIADIAHEVLVMLSRAKSAKELESTVNTAKPLIDQILQLLADSTFDFYRVRVGLVGATITDTEFQQETVLASIDDLAGKYALPPAGTELALQRAQLESEVSLLRATIAPDIAGRPLPVGSSPYDAEAQARIGEQVSVLRALCADRRTRAEALVAYHAHLGEYVRLLVETNQYFDALVRTTDPKEIAAQGHAVSTHAGKLRTEMRHARSAQAFPVTLTR
jgi:hypothetical protein